MFIPCRLKQLPDEHRVAAARTAITINPANAPTPELLPMPTDEGPDERPLIYRLALLTSKYWGAGGVKLTVSFLDFPPDLQARILTHMNAWAQWSNVAFTLTSGQGQVRIARTPGDGYWSYLGPDVLHIPADQPTMNLDSFSMQTPESEYRRVVRHETGHTLGFPHEHMRREIVQKIDPAKAIAYFMRTQGWTADDVRQQVLTPLDEASLTATPHADVTSIMCYQLPGSITTDGQPIPGGVDIDPTDADLVAKLYPRSGGPPSPPPPPPPPTVTVTLTTLDPVITAGQGARLRWASTGAAYGNVGGYDLNPGELASGELTVHPIQTVKFTAAFADAAGNSAYAYATVTVVSRPVPPSPPAPPSPPPPAVQPLFVVDIGRSLPPHSYLSIDNVPVRVPKGRYGFVPISQSQRSQTMQPGLNVPVVTATPDSVVGLLRQVLARQQADTEAILAALLGSPASAPSDAVGLRSQGFRLPGGQVRVLFTWDAHSPDDTVDHYNLQTFNPDGSPGQSQAPPASVTSAFIDFADDTRTYTATLTAFNVDGVPDAHPPTVSFSPHTEQPPPPPQAAPNDPTGFTAAPGEVPSALSPFSAGVSRGSFAFQKMPMGMNWHDILTKIEALVARFGPAAKPMIVALVNASTLPAGTKSALLMLVDVLLPN